MTDSMTRGEVLAAKARAQKATEGPLACTPVEGYHLLVGKTIFPILFEVSDDSSLVALITKYSGHDENNGQFFAAARTDVPRLAATLLDVVQVLSWEVAAHPGHCNCHSCKWLRKFEGGE